HGICHGGIIFLLADAAMGRASNTTVSSLASHAEVDFLTAVPLGSRLRATAELRRHRKKLRIWDVSVVIVEADGSAEVVAEFRGRTIQIADH
ncbi:MAG: phenylacetic acid degradation protein PaaD, partial [Acidimicrobiia bacterium]|nr:phenylacetic acid degradation protein PaaD [Acidimicrobiia bacterium]